MPRRQPSRAATLLVGRDLIRGRVLDCSCGYGLDARQFGWEAYDPYYRPVEPVGPFDTIVCTLGLNVLSRPTGRGHRPSPGVAAPDGRAYLTVARNLPVTGRLACIGLRSMSYSTCRSSPGTASRSTN
jgi:hypothetical protein